MIKQKVYPMKKKGKGWFGDPEGHARAASHRKVWRKQGKKSSGGGQRELRYHLERLLLAIEFEYPDVAKRSIEIKADIEKVKAVLNKNKD